MDMLENLRKTTQITAQSMVAVGEEGNTRQAQAAYMSANITDDGNVSITKSITDNAAYMDNRADVRKDFSDFENAVYAAEDGGNMA